MTAQTPPDAPPGGDELEAVPNDPRLGLAATLRTISLLLERPRDGWLSELTALVSDLSDPALREAVQAAGKATEGEYLAILGPGGTVSPRQTAYAGIEDPGRNLADISSYYEAFAYHPQCEDPPDHISVEVGFLSYLLLKEAFASAQGASEPEAITADARTGFLKAHLAGFARAFTDRLTQQDNAPAHLRLSTLLLSQTLDELPASPPHPE